MANIAIGQEIPIDAFEPRQDPARLPANLALVGRFIAKSALVAALMPPDVIVSESITIRRAFYMPLLVLIIFGFGMIVLSWLVSDDPIYYGAMGRAGMRASQIMLVFAAALHELANRN